MLGCLFSQPQQGGDSEFRTHRKIMVNLPGEYQTHIKSYGGRRVAWRDVLLGDLGRIREHTALPGTFTRPAAWLSA